MGLIDAIRKVQGTVSPATTVPNLPIEDRRVLLVYLFPLLGDTITVLPVIKALLDHGVKPPVGLVMYPRFADVLKTTRLDVKTYFATDVYGAGADAHPDLAGAWDVAVDLTQRELVDSEGWIRSSQAPVTLGYEGSQMSFTWAAPNHRYGQYQHWSRYLTDPLAPFSLQPHYDVPFHWPPSATSAAEKKWEGRPRILMIPGGSRDHNCWPPDMFVQVAKTLHDTQNASLVLVGAPKERPTLSKMKTEIGARVRLYCGKSMTQLVALIKSADVVVTNDTGPMHFAYLLETPTVAAFRSMSPLCWGPPRKSPQFEVLDYTQATDASAAVQDCIPRMLAAVARLTSES